MAFSRFALALLLTAATASARTHKKTAPAPAPAATTAAPDPTPTPAAAAVVAPPPEAPPATPAPAAASATAAPAHPETPAASPESASVAAHKASTRPKLLILELKAAGVDAQVAGAVSESVTNEVAARGVYDVIGAREAQTMLALDRQRQVLGCGEESCESELAGALGARFVLSGTLAKLGEAYQLTLQTLDTVRAQPIGRATKIASDLKSLLGTLPYTVSEATGTPLPPPPSRVLPFAVMGAGAAAIVAGGLVGMGALNREDGLRRELARGAVGPATPASGAVIDTRASYQKEAADIGVTKTLSLAVMLGGAALIGVGVLINPPEVAVSSGVKVALVPSGNGAALVGVMP